MLKKNSIIKLINNCGLLMFGSVMVFSGLLLQIGYHHGHHGEIEAIRLVLGLNYFNWSDIHIISIILVSIGMVFHILWHWQWFKIVLQKRKLLIKNQQAILLTIIFLLVAATGYISWSIKLNGGSEIIRKDFIEIHDKITWILFVYLILHVKKRFKWYFSALGKSRRKRNSIDIKNGLHILEIERK